MRRILQFIETTGPGGAETVFLSLLSGLDRAEWTVIPVITGPGWVSDQISSMGIDPFQIPTSGSFDIRFLYRLRRLMARESVDLVHAHLQGATVYGALAARLSGIPAVGTFHGFPDLEVEGATGWLKSQIVRHMPTTVTFVSGALERQALERGLVSPGRSQVIGNGIDPSLFRPERSSSWGGERTGRPPPFLVGSLGNLRPAKDYGTLLRAASRLKDDRKGVYRFSVFGERTEPLHSDLLALREHLGLTEEDVRFHGFVTDVPEVLSRLDLLVISSASEGFSLAAIQAMAAGVPVVSTQCGGPEEIIQNGEDGVLVPVGDPGALAEAIQRVSESPADRQRMVRAALTKVKQTYSVQAVVSQYEAVYRKALGLSSVHTERA